MNRRIYILVLTLIVCMSFPTVSYASACEKSDNPIQLRWTFLDIVDQYFDIKSGKATIEAITKGESNVTNASVIVNLQRKSGTNSWKTVKSWTVSENDNTASFRTTWLVSTGYYYRLETIHSASDNGKKESTVLISAERYAM